MQQTEKKIIKFSMPIKKLNLKHFKNSAKSPNFLQTSLLSTFTTFSYLISHLSTFYISFFIPYPCQIKADDDDDKRKLDRYIEEQRDSLDDQTLYVGEEEKQEAREEVDALMVIYFSPFLYFP